MSFARRLLHRLSNSVRPHRADVDLEREIDAHLALLTADYQRRGLTAEDAAAQARRSFGSVAHAKDLHRDSRAFAWWDDLRRDVRFAIRTLRRQPGFTAVAVLTLSIGIGVNTVVFTVTNAVLFRGFPLVDGNDRLVYMTSVKGCCVSYPDFEDWRAQATSFAGMAMVHGIPATVSDGISGGELHAATRITANTFRLIGQTPVLGRDFSSQDEQPGALPVALLRHGFWQRRFAGDPGVVGRVLRVNGIPTRVIGIMPAGFSFPQNQDLWLPFVPTAQERRRDQRNTWFVLGRLAVGATVEQARAEMTAIGTRLGAAYPESNQGRSPVPFVSTFEEFFIGASAGAMYRAMWGAVGLVLLVACANLANLLLARGLTRAREFSLRMAIGAGRWRVIRQLLIESLVLAVMGGLGAFWIARWGVDAYAAAANGSGISEETFGLWFRDILDYSMDYRVFAYLAGISIATGVLFGLVPALRLSKLDVNGTLKDGGRSVTADTRSRRLSTVLVAAEIALAIVLLAGGGVLMRSFLTLYRAEPGFSPARVAITRIGLPAERYGSREAQRRFADQLMARTGANADVEAIATASALPGWNLAQRPFEIDGIAPERPQQRPAVGAVTIGGDYFRTLGVPLTAGRRFGSRDSEPRELVAIANERFVRRYLSGREPIGTRVRLYTGPTPGQWMTIVGVAPDIAQSRDLQGRDPLLYIPYQQHPAPELWLLARTKTGADTAATIFRRDVRALDPDLPLGDGPYTLGERLAENYQYHAVVAMLFGLFAAIALLLAALGLYAVTAHAVSQRTQEIGVRTAVGASARDILILVARQGSVPLAAGIASGVAVSLALGAVLRAEFAQVTPADPVMLTVACGTLVAAAVVGCLVPAQRAIRVDPVVALRAD